MIGCDYEYMEGSIGGGIRRLALFLLDSVCFAGNLSYRPFFWLSWSNFRPDLALFGPELALLRPELVLF
jgi:hypothetical protein